MLDKRRAFCYNRAMLEFLGFIALIAIIFGVSFGTALAGFIKFVVIGIGVCAIIGIVMELLKSKKGAIFVAVASLLAVLLGVYMINDDYGKRIGSCGEFNVRYPQVHVNCMTDAMEKHNAAVNSGWGYIIAGGIVGATSLSKISEVEKNSKKH